MANPQPAVRLEREIADLRDRLSRLSAASLRIRESGDLDTVLQDVLDTARSLTGARYGVFTLLDDDGAIERYLASGMSAAEARRIWEAPDGRRTFTYLAGLTGPLRIPDLLDHLAARGLPAFSPPEGAGAALSFLATPIGQPAARSGHLFVAGKERLPEFRPEDEETLVLFASQAALVIANARRYRDERRARADLETLVDTSPVGVVVFDARTGTPVTVNQEAQRLVGGLRQPDQKTEQPLVGITVRRADGREHGLAAFSVAEALPRSETVRAEEITLSAADGRSVGVLLNATPIRSADGSIASIVATLQDLTPREELERLRAEFLAMVSDELRLPLTSIKGAAATALGAAALERADLVQFFRIVDHQADRMQELIAGLLDMAKIASGTLSVQAEPSEPQRLVNEAAGAVVGGADRLELALPPGLPWVMADRQRIVQVLGALLSEAARQAPHEVPIRIEAEPEGLELAFSVNGQRGTGALELPREPKARFARGATVEQERGFGGPDLRLAICRGIVEAHGGRLRVERDAVGMRFSFTLPVAEQPADAALQAIRGSGQEGIESPPDGRARILALAGDAQTLRQLRETLAGAGYAPVVSAHPPDLAQLVVTERPQLALLDLHLPGTDALDMMDEILSPAGVPTILLLPDGQEEAVAQALDRGAADYLIQPFSPTELTARIRAALRRGAAASGANVPEPYRQGELRIDYAERRVSLAGETLQLTATEFELLRRLSVAAGRVLTHDQLLQSVWSREKMGETHLVRNVVKRLRRKLGEDADTPSYIFTEPRVGYRMPRSAAEEPGESAR